MSFGCEKDIDAVRRGWGIRWCAIHRGQWGSYLVETMSRTKAECHKKLKAFVQKINAQLQKEYGREFKKNRLKDFEECWVNFVSIYDRDTSPREGEL